MALNDVLSDLQADKKEKKTADKKYVSFLKEEWAEMEKTYGKSIEPNDVKKLNDADLKALLNWILATP